MESIKCKLRLVRARRSQRLLREQLREVITQMAVIVAGDDFAADDLSELLVTAHDLRWRLHLSDQVLRCSGTHLREGAGE